MTGPVTYPIGSLQVLVLAAIRETPGINIKALVRKCKSDSGSVSHAVVRLEKRGLATSQKGRTPSGQMGRLCYPVPA